LNARISTGGWTQIIVNIVLYYLLYLLHVFFINSEFLILVFLSGGKGPEKDLPSLCRSLIRKIICLRFSWMLVLFPNCIFIASGSSGPGWKMSDEWTLEMYDDASDER
jgi:hypothetical protein